MLKVYLTIDTEIWPLQEDWPRQPLSPVRTDFEPEYQLFIDGKTARGSFGVDYQLTQFARYDLRANFFVEALSAGRLGHKLLERTVKSIKQAGQDVQLHVHSEWLGELQQPGLPLQFAPFLHDFDFDEQSAMIATAARQLRAAGAGQIQAFRAGSFGANLATMAALAANGIPIDTSYNPTRLHADWRAHPRLHQPVCIGGVWEFPVSSFCDYPGHLRHAQLCACSFDEMRSALIAASQANWDSFVIVLHSFELIKQRHSLRTAEPDQLLLRRFDQLCQFLAQEKSRFRTCWFSDTSLPAQAPHHHASLIHSRLSQTVQRVAEQAWSRLRS